MRQRARALSRSLETRFGLIGIISILVMMITRSSDHLQVVMIYTILFSHLPRWELSWNGRFDLCVELLIVSHIYRIDCWLATWWCL
jgi:hypothetical protein